MRAFNFLVFLMAISISSFSHSEEYFGAFVGGVKGEFISAKPRPKFKLSHGFQYDDPNGLVWSVPPDVEVDGASIPQEFWSFIGGPFEGEYIRASVIHDYYCDVKTRTEHDTHRNFYYGMRAAGVEKWKAKFMYWAVETFGPTWVVTQRVSQQLSCSSVGDQMDCRQVPVLGDKLVSFPSVDLGDPDTLAAALSKASAVARSLKTSDGEILDVTAGGQVTARLDDISNSAEKYRQVFYAQSFKTNPAALGVLSQWNAAGLDKVEPWDNNVIPQYKSSAALDFSTVARVREGESFRLDARSGGLLRDRINFDALDMKSSSGDL
jgi:hypothetical protein